MNESTVQLKETKPLPEGWQWVRLGDVCMINPSRPNGFTRLLDAPTTFVPMAAVDGNLGVISKPGSRSYSEVSTGYTYFGEADVLFAKITPCMQNGKHAIARNLLDGVGFGSTEFHVIRPSVLILPEWIHFFIRQPFFLQEAASYFVGAVGQQRVPESFLANYGIPLPPLPEQRHIAAKVQELMKDVERARAACETQLESAKALPQAYLRQVFESEEAKKWERRRLGELFDVQQGVAMSPERREGRTPYPFLRTLNVLWGCVDLSMLDKMDFTDEEVSKLSLKPGDLLVCEGGEVGRTAIWRGEMDTCLYQNHIHRLRKLNDTIVPQFYMYWMQAAFQVFGSYSGEESKTTIPNLSGNRLKSFMFPLPPTEEQKRIAAEFKDQMAGVEKLKASIEKELEGINTLPQAILRKAFRGEL